MKRLIGFFKRKYKKRKSRILIRKFHSVQLTSDSNSNIFEVVNVSSSGMGLVLQNNNTLTLGEEVDAKFKLGKFNISIKFIVSRIGKKLIGIQIIENNIQYENILRAYFISEVKGMGLTKVNTNILKAATEGKPTLYYGDGDNELYYIVNADKINFLQITYRGYVIRFGHNDLSCGKIISDAPADKLAYKGSSLVDMSIEFPDGMLDEFNRFIHSIYDLPREDLEFIEDLFTKLRDK